MLHIIQQYTQLFSSLLQTNFAEAAAGENYGPLIEQVSKKAVQARYKETLKKFLEANATIFADGQITDFEVGNGKDDKSKLLAALQKIALEKQDSDSRSLVEYFSSILKLQEEVKADIAALKADLKVSQVDTSKIVAMEAGTDNKIAVAQLQQLLVALGLLGVSDVGNAVGVYGPKTKAAVSQLQSLYNSAKPSKGKKSVELTINGNVDAATITAIKDIQGNDVIGLVKHIKTQGNVAPDAADAAPRKAKTEKVKTGDLEAQIGKTAVSIDTMIKFLKESSIVLEAIEDGKDFEAQGYSLLNIARRLLGTNAKNLAEDQIWEKLVGRKDVGRQAKGFKQLIGNSSFEYNQDNKFDRGFKKLIGSHHFDNNMDHGSGNEFGPRALKHAKKLLPWVLGIYVADIPLPFIKSAFPNVDMDKAFAFTQWVKAGMPGEFNPKEKVNTGADALQNLKGLRHILATSTDYIRAQKNYSSLKDVTAKVRELITTYIVHRFAPDADVLRSSTQNVFENLFDAIGLKGPEAKLISAIVKSAKSGKVDFNQVFQLEAILAQNDRTGGLFGLGAGENSTYLEIFRNRNSYMAGVQRQGDILDIYVEAIYKGEESYSKGKEAFEAVQKADRAMGPAIPDAMKGVPYNKLRRGVYGKKLRENMSGEEVLASLQSVKPSKKKNWDSLGWITNNMRNLETDMDARKLSYEALAAGIRKGKMIPMSQFAADMGVVNSSIGGNKIFTSVAGLMKRGDTHMFKASVELNDGGSVVRYTLYLRPDCSNFLMVPEQFDNRAFGATTGKLPIVIPWTLIPHVYGGGGSGTGSLPIDGDPTSIPGVIGPK